MADPNGTVIGSVEVEIRAKLDALEKDLRQAEARFQKFSDDQKKTASATNVMQKEFAIVERQMIAMAGGLGIVGTALSSVGTYGLVAAAGLGVLDKAFTDTVASARTFGAGVQDLFNQSASTGFAIGDIKALKNAAEELGLSGEHVNMWLMRFNMALGDVRRGGTGPLYDALEKLDHGLVVAVRDAKTNAEAFDLVSKAALNAGTNADMFYRALGRGGQQAAPLFKKVSEGGGLEKYVEASKKVALITEEELDVRRKIEGIIKSSTDDAEKLWQMSAARAGSVFGGTDDMQSSLQKQAEQFKLLSQLAAQSMSGENWLYLWVQKQWIGAWTSSWVPDAMRDAFVKSRQEELVLKGKVSINSVSLSEEGKQEVLDGLQKTVEFWEARSNLQRSRGGSNRQTEIRLEAAKQALEDAKAGRKITQAGEQPSGSYEPFKATEDQFGAFGEKALKVQRDEAAAQKKINDELAKTKQTAEDAANAFTDFSAAIKILGTGATLVEQQRLSELQLNAERAKGSNNLGVQLIQMREGIKLTKDDIEARKDEIAEVQKEANARVDLATKMVTQMSALGALRSVMGTAAPQGLQDAMKRLELEQQIMKLRDFGKSEAGKELETQGFSFDEGALQRYKKLQVEMQRETALGVTAVRTQEQAIKLEMATMGMAVGPATEVKIVQEALNKAWIESGGDLDVYNRKAQEIMKTLPQFAQLLGQVRTEQERLKINADIMRERQTMFLSDEDARIAEKLKGLYPDVTEAINSAEAAQMRFNDRLKEAMSYSSDFAKSFAHDLMAGKSATEALRNSLSGLATKLMDKGIEGGMKSLFSGMFGGDSSLGKMFGAQSLNTIGSTAANAMWVRSADAAIGSLTGSGTGAANGITGATGGSSSVPGLSGLLGKFKGSSTGTSGSTVPSFTPSADAAAANPNIYQAPTANSFPEQAGGASVATVWPSVTTPGQLTGGATIPPHIANDPQAMAALNNLSTNQGVSPEAAAMVINTESGWKTNAQTGSYSGFSQIGKDDLAKMGYTPESFKAAPPAEQIGGYDQWLTNYGAKEKWANAGINPSEMSVPQQAALLQGTQFGPNRTQLFGKIGQGTGGDVPFTTTPQASALGSTSMNDMTKYYEGVYKKNPGQFSAGSSVEPTPFNGGSEFDATKSGLGDLNTASADTSKQLADLGKVSGTTGEDFSKLSQNLTGMTNAPTGAMNTPTTPTSNFGGMNLPKTPTTSGVNAESPTPVQGQSFDQSLAAQGPAAPTGPTNMFGTPIPQGGSQGFDESGMISGSESGGGGASMLSTGVGGSPTKEFEDALKKASPEVAKFGDVNTDAGADLNGFSDSIGQTTTTIPNMTASMEGAAVAAGTKAAADETGTAASAGKAVADESGAVASTTAASADTAEAAASFEAAAGDTAEAGASIGKSAGMFAMFGLAGGGEIKGAGGPTEDRVPVMASPGEFIVNAESTKKYRAELEAINSGSSAMMGNMWGTMSASKNQKPKSTTISPKEYLSAGMLNSLSMDWDHKAEGGMVGEQPMYGVPRAQSGMLNNAMRDPTDTTHQTARNAPGGSANARAHGEQAGNNVRIVNAFDSASFLQEALTKRDGEQVLFNFVRANQRTFRNALK